MKFKQSLLTIYIISAAILLSSCKDPYLYDKVGFGAGGLPINPPANPNAINRIAPDYYYRQSTPYYPNSGQVTSSRTAPRMAPRTAQQVSQVQPNSQAAFQRNDFRQPQTRQNTQNQPRNYQRGSGGLVDYNSQFIQPQNNFQSNQRVSRDSSQVVPGSRFYSNPYSIPASNRYMRYDTDQYYAPPLNSQNVETVEYGIRNIPKY